VFDDRHRGSVAGLYLGSSLNGADAVSTPQSEHVNGGQARARIGGFEEASAHLLRGYRRTSLGLLIFTSSHVISTVLALINCVDVQGRRVLLAAPRIECDSPSYLAWSWFGWLLLFLVTLGLPGFVGFRLWNAHRQHGGRPLSEPNFVRVWGVFFESYKPRFYWFEALLFLRRSSLVIISVLLWKWPLYRSLSLSMLCLCWLAVHFFTKPHVATASNALESGLLVDLMALSLLQLPAAVRSSDAGRKVGPAGPEHAQALTVFVDVMTTILIIPPAIILLIIMLAKPIRIMRRKLRSMNLQRTAATRAGAAIDKSVAIADDDDPASSAHAALLSARVNHDVTPRLEPIGHGARGVSSDNISPRTDTFEYRELSDAAS